MKNITSNHPWCALKMHRSIPKLFALVINLQSVWLPYGAKSQPDASKFTVNKTTIMLYLTIDILFNMNAPFVFLSYTAGLLLYSLLYVCLPKDFTLVHHLGAFWQSSAFIFPLSELWFLSWYLAMNLIFLSSFFLMVDSWTLTKAKDKETCRPLDVETGFLFWLPAWFLYFALGEILAGWSLLGRFTTVPESLHSYSLELAEVQWSPGAFGMTLEGFPDWQASTSSLWRC